MAMIFEFSTHAAKGLRATRSSRGGSAEIVIFPGVRYERAPEAPATSVKRRATQRDRIELPD